MHERESSGARCHEEDEYCAMVVPATTATAGYCSRQLFVLVVVGDEPRRSGAAAAAGTTTIIASAACGRIAVFAKTGLLSSWRRRRNRPRGVVLLLYH